MSPAEDRISNLPNEIQCHILSFLPSSQIALTSLHSQRWKTVWLTMPNADRISALPISVICRILSLLPFKQLVLTAFLSKRWRSAHTRMTQLNLDDRPYDENTLSFLYMKVLEFLIRIDEHSLTTFTFASSSTCGCAAMAILLPNLNVVKHLSLTFFNYSFSTLFLNYHAFTRSTLVEIYLDGLTIDYVHRFHTNLPLLKILHLTNVRVFHIKFLIKLLSVCPLLEDLLFKNLQVTDNVLGKTIYFPDGAVTIDDMLKPFPKLLKLDISDSDISCYLLPFKLFYNVEFLRTQVPLQLLEEQEGCFSAAEFLNLTHLELSFEDNKYCWNWLIEFIRGCPVLQCLVIRKIRGSGNDNVAQNWLDPQFIVPECLSSQLQMLSFRNYGGKESDLQFTKYIIRNARVLRNVTIHRNNCSSNPPEEEELQMIKELQSCQRASDKLHFEWTMED